MAQSNLLPDRPGEPDCIFYLRTGSCGYGNNCRFNHPAYASQVAKIYVVKIFRPCIKFLFVDYGPCIISLALKCPLCFKEVKLIKMFCCVNTNVGCSVQWRSS